MPINFLVINKKIKTALESGATTNRLQAIVRERANLAADSVVTVMNSEFDRHLVTKELSDGAGATTRQNLPSGPSGGKYGNLAAYFGLPSDKIGEDLANLRGLLSVRRVEVVRNGLSFIIRLKFLNIENYYRATPPPDDSYSVSWLYAMEQAVVKNFGHFLFRLRGFKSDVSRSGTGVQVENTLRQASGFPKIPYISDIYQKVLGAAGKGRQIFAAAIRKRL